MVLANTENVGDDVMLRVSLVPEGLEDLVSLVNLALHTIAKHLLDQQGMRLITHLKKSTSSLGLKMYTHYMYVASVVIQHVCIVEEVEGRGGSSSGSSSNLEHIFSINKSKPSIGRLKIVESL